MKRTRKISAFIGLMLIIANVCALCGVTVSAATVTPTEARSSVVAVVREDGGGQGSGFAIGEVGKPVEYIVTNDHVVKGEWGYTTATVVFSGASNEGMTANVYYYDAEKDIAVLKLPEKTTKRKALTLCPMKFVDLDDSFAALGYPDSGASDWQKYNEDDITITKGGIKKKDRMNGQDVYLMDIEINPGNSGGPLINSKGEVVGINKGAVEYTTSGKVDNYAIAIDELLDRINTDKIPVTVRKSNILLYSLIGGGILLAIIALVAILAMRGKGNGGGRGEVINRGDDPVPMTSPRQQPRQPQPKPGARVRIIAIGGTMNGKKYELDGTAKFGRDSSQCKIAFPVNTQGVSGVHCEISFDGSACYIKDLNSSYGTFITEGNRRLAPNVPVMLKSGDKFYLASPDNTFEVRF